jgi:hypothetical protein
MTQALTEVEMQSPEPQGLAEHWGRILGLSARKVAEGHAELVLPNARFRFTAGESEIMSGLTFRVADVAKVCDAARAKGYAVSDDSFLLGGVTFRLAG